jgi:hypothetical protein
MYNKLVAAGGLTSLDGYAESRCQTLLTPTNILLSAILVGFEVSQGAHVIPGVIRQALKIDEPVAKQTIAWTQTDFELLHYEYAFLGTGGLMPRGWILPRLNAEIKVEAIDIHPYFAGGLQVLLRIPKDSVKYQSNHSINKLNDISFMFGESPYFGAWCDDGDDLCYTSFLPNNMKGIMGLESELVAACLMRTKELPKLIKVLDASPEYSA